MRKTNCFLSQFSLNLLKDCFFDLKHAIKLILCMLFCGDFIEVLSECMFVTVDNFCRQKSSKTLVSDVVLKLKRIESTTFTKR
jgi:hypothetical protein